LIVVGIAAGLYLASMALPVVGFKVRGWDPTTYVCGYEVFLTSFRAFYADDGWEWERIALVAAWMANPAIWCAFVCLVVGWRYAASILAGTSCILGMCALPEHGPWIIGLPGYWFWWGSFVAAFLGALFVLPRRSLAYAEDFAPMNEAPNIPFASPTNDPLTPV
jgi:hypothetical protein